MSSRLHDAKLAYAGAQLKIWKAKLRREDAKYAEKAPIIEWAHRMGEQTKKAALEASAILPRTAALERLPATIDFEVEEIADKILRFDTRPEDVEEINNAIKQGDEDNEDD